MQSSVFCTMLLSFDRSCTYEGSNWRNMHFHVRQKQLACRYAIVPTLVMLAKPIPKTYLAKTLAWTSPVHRRTTKQVTVILQTVRTCVRHASKYVINLVLCQLCGRHFQLLQQSL